MPNSGPMTDREQAMAVLVSIAKDSNPHPAVRVDAARTVLAYTHDDPRPIPTGPRAEPDWDENFGDQEPSDSRFTEDTAELTYRAAVCLTLVWDEVPLKPSLADLVAATHEELREIIEWAQATHLVASDNDDVEIPPVPDVLVDPAFKHGLETDHGGPHSRACGWQKHEHGSACSTNCPTCGGKP